MPDIKIDRIAASIAGRLSLREPQRKSLEILTRVTEVAPPSKNQDVASALKVIQAEYPSVTGFERDFPSLCFALATGVGKTRLMGAFITYLHLAHKVNHFFVLAPQPDHLQQADRRFHSQHAQICVQGNRRVRPGPSSDHHR